MSCGVWFIVVTSAARMSRSVPFGFDVWTRTFERSAEMSSIVRTPDTSVWGAGFGPVDARRRPSSGVR
jgi:hypothetical protein